jgi:hypothetical protein
VAVVKSVNQRTKRRIIDDDDDDDDDDDKSYNEDEEEDDDDDENEEDQMDVCRSRQRRHPKPHFEKEENGDDDVCH